MLNEMPRTGAAAVRRFAAKNPVKILKDMRDADATADDKRLFKAWRKRCQVDDDLDEAIYLHAFANMLSTIEQPRQPRKRRPPTKSQIAAERRAVEVLTRRMGTVKLMDLMMPNGKKLRDCTLAECGTFGSWFRMIATKGKPSDIVGKVLTEADLQKIR